MPLATAGEEVKTLSSVIVYSQRSAPVLAFRAYKLPSSDPTYTTPLATAGEESIASPVAYFHCNALVLAFKAYTLLSSDPIYTTPLATAGEELTSPIPRCQMSAPVL